MSVDKSRILTVIVPGLAEDLRDLPDGVKTGLGELIADSYWADESFTQEELAFLQETLVSEAEKIKIQLDMEEDGAFIVHNAAAKYVCPFCGSRNTGHIIYGLPFFTPQLEKKLESGRAHLGGCMPRKFDRLCNDCQHEFSTYSDMFDRKSRE